MASYLQTFSFGFLLFAIVIAIISFINLFITKKNDIAEAGGVTQKLKSANARFYIGFATAVTLFLGSVFTFYKEIVDQEKQDLKEKTDLRNSLKIERKRQAEYDTIRKHNNQILDSSRAALNGNRKLINNEREIINNILGMDAKPKVTILLNDGLSSLAKKMEVKLSIENNEKYPVHNLTVSVRDYDLDPVNFGKHTGEPNYSRKFRKSYEDYYNVLSINQLPPRATQELFTTVHDYANIHYHIVLEWQGEVVDLDVKINISSHIPTIGAIAILRNGKKIRSIKEKQGYIAIKHQPRSHGMVKFIIGSDTGSVRMNIVKPIFKSLPIK